MFYLQTYLHYFLYINVYDLAMIAEAEGEVRYPMNRLKPPVILNYRMRQGGTCDMVLYVPCVGVDFCTVSPSACLIDIYLGSGS